MGSILRDARIAFRTLMRSRGFALVTVLTLAVAIGANTAIYTVVEAVLLKPLPYPDSDELVTVYLDASGAGVPELPFSPRGYWFFKDNHPSFENWGGVVTQQWALTGPEGQPLQLSVGLISRSALETLGANPVRGRFPSPEEDLPDGADVALLGHGLWVDRFGEDPEILGQTIELNGVVREVIGIMPPAFAFPDPSVSIWVPLQVNPASENFGGHGIQAIARLRDGVTVESAVTEAEGLIQRFEEAGYGPQWLANVFTGRAIVRRLQEEIVGDSRQPLLIVLGTVGFVLLIACSNVANLLLVRAEARTRQTAVQVALGASRGRLIQGVMVEAVILALLGGVLGLLLAWAGTRALVAVGPAAIPRLQEIGMSTGVLLFTTVVSLGAGVLFGVFPAFKVGSKKMVVALRDGGRGSTIGRDRHRVRNALVVLQVAMALFLLVGSGLMVRSFQQLRAVDPGFRSNNVITFGLSLPPSRYPDMQTSVRFFDDLLADLEALPGVASAAGINALPLSGGGPILATQIEDFPIGPDDFPPAFPIRFVSPGYFETMGIPVVEGRAFENRDHEEGLTTALISESLKEQYWPETSPIGRRLGPGILSSVVGVVGDVHDAGLSEPVRATIYLPMLDSVGRGVRALTIAVRTDVEPMSVVPTIRSTIAQRDASLPITDIQTMGGVVADSISRTTFTMSLLLLGALIALFLGSVGIYGVISYVVTQRTNEMGVRLALGAEGGAIRSMVLRYGITLTAVGIVLGGVAAVAGGGLISSLLYGVSPLDPATLTGGALVFLLVAGVASLVPAVRASRIDPASALRAD